jgi:hypothetical protein
MTDRELLELAAKAAGVHGYYRADFVPGIVEPVIGGGDVPWNPKRNDGQCAQLEAALSICVMWEREQVEVFHFEHGYLAEKFASHNDDKNAARRAASVRMAAEIGKAMP